MAFKKEAEPARGVAIDVLPGIRRVVARNPSPMTYHGTNTYLLDGPDGLTVIDPGPEDAQHVRDVVHAAAGVPIARLVLTHTHSDHDGAVPALREATGAPCWGYGAAAAGSPADHDLADGQTLAGLQAVFTPGHAADHLSFQYHVPGTGQILFSGDHVMAWSSSIVDPLQGDMRAYYRSLELLLLREDRLYLPGHGPMAGDPKMLVSQLLRHRHLREAEILRALQTPASVGEIAGRLYAKTEEALRIAAQRNVLAHLLKLQAEGRVVPLDATPPCTAPPPQTDDREMLKAAYQKIMTIDAGRRFSRT